LCCQDDPNSQLTATRRGTLKLRGVRLLGDWPAALAAHRSPSPTTTQMKAQSMALTPSAAHVVMVVFPFSCHTALLLSFVCTGYQLGPFLVPLHCYGMQMELFMAAAEAGRMKVEIEAASRLHAWWAMRSCAAAGGGDCKGWRAVGVTLDHHVVRAAGTPLHRHDVDDQLRCMLCSPPPPR
jgi:hypothetical protein